MSNGVCWSFSPLDDSDGEGMVDLQKMKDALLGSLLLSDRKYEASGLSMCMAFARSENKPGQSTRHEIGERLRQWIT